MRTRHAGPEDELPDLVINPYRPKEYDRLTKPRAELRKALKNTEKTV
ncbi:MAG TPA: hypothetical protein VFC78_18880 [Tepidisphaeraceae bacterium]|nr:hypothetical protein [Tepidisphaeraceae bacterium]